MVALVTVKKMYKVFIIIIVFFDMICVNGQKQAFVRTNTAAMGGIVARPNGSRADVTFFNKKSYEWLLPIAVGFMPGCGYLLQILNIAFIIFSILQ